MKAKVLSTPGPSTALRIHALPVPVVRPSWILVKVKACGHRIALALAFALNASMADAGPIEDGIAAFEQGDYATVLRLWRPLAEHGEVRAQFTLGFMYYSGHGVAQDYAEALHWFRAAAVQGDADAQDRLGMMYSLGRGVAQDYQEERQWYGKAAAQGHPAAQFQLGYIYASGRGVTADPVEAFKWYRLAAAQTTDPETRDAAGRAQATLAAHMTVEQLATAQHRAHDWKPLPGAR